MRCTIMKWEKGRYKVDSSFTCPESQRQVTTVCPGPKRCATCTAADTFSPDEAPTNSPSSFSNRKVCTVHMFAFRKLSTGTLFILSQGHSSTELSIDIHEPGPDLSFISQNACSITNTTLPIQFTRTFIFQTRTPPHSPSWRIWMTSLTILMTSLSMTNRASSIGASLRFSVKRPWPMPSVMELPSDRSSLPVLK